MRIARAMALAVLLVGVASCATTQDRYYVAGNDRGGDYYYAPAPRDDIYDPYYYGGFGWGSPFAGYCAWGLASCGYGFNDWRYFSFGLSYGYDPWWWGNTRYSHPHRRPSHDSHWPPTDSSPWPDQDDGSRPRRERSREPRPDSTERNQPPPMRDVPDAPEPTPRSRARERHDGRPPAAA